MKLKTRILFGKDLNNGNVTHWHCNDSECFNYTVHEVGIFRSIFIDLLDKNHLWAGHPIARWFRKFK